MLNFLLLVECTLAALAIPLGVGLGQMYNDKVIELVTVCEIVALWTFSAVFITLVRVRLKREKS